MTEIYIQVELQTRKMKEVSPLYPWRQSLFREFEHVGEPLEDISLSHLKACRQNSHVTEKVISKCLQMIEACLIKPFHV